MHPSENTTKKKRVEKEEFLPQYKIFMMVIMIKLLDGILILNEWQLWLNKLCCLDARSHSLS